MWTTEPQTLRWYGKVENLLNREYFDNGFRTPGITWVTGLRMNFH
ncbi:MAG TPA: hypothetical protein VM120_07970 [Bryobacteraceae bacterium]|nr:hypothetical protein [Bryobacteraceae bacterium]